MSALPGEEHLLVEEQQARGHGDGQQGTEDAEIFYDQEEDR